MTEQEKKLVQVWRNKVANKQSDDSDETLLQVINMLELQRPGSIGKLTKMIDSND